MTKRAKMCKYRDSKSLKEQAYRCAERFGIDSNPCPDYANESCQIITPKRKAKLVKVRGWAMLVNDGITASTRWYGFDGKRPQHSYPCHILIEKKFLREEK